jgi:hypothetical protein
VTRLGRLLIGLSILALELVGCGGQTTAPSVLDQRGAAGGFTLTQECDRAFAAAAAAATVDAPSDRVADLDPAIRDCVNLDDWTGGATLYPAALDGADPIAFLSQRCQVPGVASLPLCAAAPPE